MMSMGENTQSRIKGMNVRMNFSKMQGLGNDFVVVDCVTQNVHLSPEMIKKIANRQLGIGCDQLLLVEPPYSPENDFHYRIFNSDGSEVEQCGNGARCFALFVRLKKLTKKRQLNVSTLKGVITLKYNDDETITVNLGVPNFEPKQIPFKASKIEKNYLLRLEHQTLLCGVVSMGNPHCVIQVPDVETAQVATLGPAIEVHERFPERVNVGFMQIIDRKQIKLRVFERSAGETYACGSGACAAVAVGIHQGLLDSDVLVQLRGGSLRIQWQGSGQPLYMTGTATHVFDGFILL